MARSVAPSSPKPPSTPPSESHDDLDEEDDSTFPSLTSLDKGELILLIERLKSSFDLSQERLNVLELERERAREEQEREGEGEEERERIRELERDLETVREREDESRRDQERMEEELVGRIEVLEKLRSSVRDLEKEKKEVTKRYREQTDSFDSERQSWFDQEQHYKVRIQNLSNARAVNNRNGRMSVEVESVEEEREEEEGENIGGEEAQPQTPTLSTRVKSNGESVPSPTELALRAQLDSLSTAHTSLTTSLRTLQTEMIDLKRVYQDLQQENESYEILLGEKTLSGEVTGTDFFRKSFSWGEGGGDGVNGTRGDGGVQVGWSGFGFEGGLEAVGEEDDLEEPDGEDDESESESDEEEGEEGEDDIEKILLESKGVGSPSSGAISAQPASRRRSSRRNKSIALAHAKRDSTVSLGMGLGGGLDLAAELMAAEKDEDLDEIEIEKKREKEERRNKKKEEREKKKREARAARRDGSQSMPVGLEDLHLEIKQLREANKALTLYVSKIVDRVCSQEGFEKVLAVDYRNSNGTPKTDATSPKQPSSETVTAPLATEPPATIKKPRPVSTGFFSRASVSPGQKEVPSTPKPANGPTSAGLAPTPSSASSVGSAANGPRKSGGLTWDGISSVFGFGSSASANTAQSPSPSAATALSRSNTITSPAHALPPVAPGMKPLMLSPNEARRLSISDEDEDDILERERLRVDMSRHGIDYAPTLAAIGRPRSSSTSITTSPPVGSPLASPPILDPVGEAEKQLRAREKEEETIRQQMKEGRGSGLTEAPQRRMSKLERRHSSRRGSSISYNISPSSSSLAINGLGIESPSPVGTSRSVSPAIEGAKEGGIVEEDEAAEGQKWTKALRRMSRGWSSPPVG
ncbi:hypothetical protein JCM16303_007433 [Sporobolomyces ruberrimus]